MRRSSELPTKFRTRPVQSLLDAGASFTRLGEGPLEPGDDRPVFVMPLAGVVRNDLEDVPRELETAFQISHVQSRLAKVCQRSECERHLFMWFGPNGLTFSTDLPGTILNQVCGQPGDSGAPVTVNNRLVGMIHVAFTEDLPTCIVKFIPLHTPAVTMSMNAVIGDVTNRNRPGSGFVPIGA